MTYVVHWDEHFKTFQFTTNRNLMWQMEYLQDCISLANSYGDEDNDYFSRTFIQALNGFATANLSESAGRIRDKGVEINGSDHKCPPAEDVAGHLEEMIEFVKSKWHKRSPFELSAFVLWRLNWIHPFVEGNGRTARAAAYFVLCRKYTILLPGKNTIIHQLSNNQSYYDGLKHADNNRNGLEHDIAPLVNLLEECFEIQLRSARIYLK